MCIDKEINYQSVLFQQNTMHIQNSPSYEPVCLCTVCPIYEPVLCWSGPYRYIPYQFIPCVKICKTILFADDTSRITIYKIGNQISNIYEDMHV